MNHTYQNKILCVIQARGGSKGVPKKNIRKVNGKLEDTGKVSIIKRDIAKLLTVLNKNN